MTSCRKGWIVSGAAAAGLALLCACAAGPNAGVPLSAEDAHALAAVEQVRVEADPKGLVRDVGVALAREGGPGVTADGKAPGLFKVEASCGTDFDYWRPPPLINEPGSGIDDSAKEHRSAHSPGSSRACEVRADFFLGKRMVWTESTRTSNLSAGELVSLSNALVAKFVKIWKGTRTAPPPP